MTTPLERAIRVRCPVEHAFHVFTARIDLWWPTHHRRFDTSTLTLEPWVGGRFFERNTEGLEHTFGHVQRCEPPHLLAYTWLPGADLGPTHVHIQFNPDGQGHTLVHITHHAGASNPDSWPARVTRFAQAWDLLTPSLTQALEANP